MTRTTDEVQTYEGYPESNLRFGIKKTQVKGNIFFIIYIWKPQS